MAKTAMILGESGDGKSTSIITPPNGELPDPKSPNVLEELKGLKGKGMNPDTTVIVNCDGKDLPFPYKAMGFEEGRNLFTSTYEKPITAETLIGNMAKKTTGLLHKINSGSKVNAVIIDTMNGAMNDKEMLDTKNLSWDKWYDLAKGFYALTVMANSMREDIVIYLLGHVALQTDIDGNEKKNLLTNGKKLEKVQLVSKVPVVLTTNVESSGGSNRYVFETQKNRSVSKSPIGMFGDFTIPNSMRLVDDKIRAYYGI